MLIRAFFEAAQVEGTPSPYDTIHLKIFYPGQMSGSDLEKNMGIVAADSDLAPFPVVIFFNGFNCDAQHYYWLAVKLAERGLVVVTFNWVTQSLPGMISLTPGVDLEARKPKVYRTIPTATALPAILAKLAQLQNQGILAGMLDLENIILGGHSEGGRVAMENADPGFFPGVVASFAYGAHTAGLVFLGYESAQILPLPDALPLLLMAGTCDGVIANSSDRYGINRADSTTTVVRTFQEAIAGGRNDSYLLLLEGANHFSIADILDSTTARPYLDFNPTQPQENFRLLIAEAISLFIDTHIRLESDASQKLMQFLNAVNPLINSFRCK
ncbi:alpha/beta hydrolase family protein [Fortiea contorta]|uniref:alpha/beta hydrolase family protein n=1 Tax=Fortiea contorta TaxID=1892405 RepID=UPI000347155F|nr:alpha/beta hydrolase [Fortiea contorta]